MSKISEAERENRQKARGACSRCEYGEHEACQGGHKSYKGETMKCTCKKARHKLLDGMCTFMSHSDWSTRMCCRPATTTIQVRAHFGTEISMARKEERIGRKPVMVVKERCNFHLSVHRRMQQGEELRAEQARVRKEEDDERHRASKAAQDWARRLREEYGVDCDAREGSRNVIINAERLYGQIAKADEVLKDVLPEEENPFRLREH